MSPVGWIVLVFLVILLVTVNLSLWNAYRGKKMNHSTWDALSHAGNRLRNPFGDEQAQMEELSRRVTALQDDKSDEPPVSSA